MTDEQQTAREAHAEEQGPAEVQTHRIAIPNVEFIDVVEACVGIGIVSGRIAKGITLFEGEAYQTVDVTFETDADSIYPYLYALSEYFPKSPVMIADGELWENTRVLITQQG